MPTRNGAKHNKAKLQVKHHINELQKIAELWGINDVISNNNLRTLQILMLLDIRPYRTYNGNDAHDSKDNDYEIKTIASGAKSVTTGRVSLSVIERYSKAHWLIGVFEDNHLTNLYYMSPVALRKYFRRWRRKLVANDRKVYNNPSFPFSLVEKHGKLLYTTESTLVKPEPPSEMLVKYVAQNHIDKSEPAVPEQLSLFDRLME